MVFLQEGPPDWERFLPDPQQFTEQIKSEPQLVSADEMAKGPPMAASQPPLMADAPGALVTGPTPSVLKALATDDDGAGDEDEDGGEKEAVATVNREEFREFLEDTFDELPRVDELRKLSAEEVHSTPQMIREGAVLMGETAEKLEQHPELKPEALEFYQKCALETGVATSIRALCLNRALRLYAELHGKLWEFDREKIPDSLIELAKRL